MSMKPVVRSMKESMDGIPIHVRQLAEMFRKHGSKKSRDNSEVQNLDSADVTHPLKDGWKKDSWYTPDRVVGSGKPNRPYPGEYLDNDYIEKHLDQFADGATRFYRADSLDRYGPGNNGTTFVFPTSEIDRIKSEASTPQELGEMLGLGPDFFVDGKGNPVDVVRADFSPGDLGNGNLRMPRGDEGGANAQWIPGGYLPEGIPEAVFNVNRGATGADPSVGGTFGNFTPFHFGS
jgi:hypothetical protein